MSIITVSKQVFKTTFSKVLFRYPPTGFGIHPERLYNYLDTLHRYRNVDGLILETGCNLGGTAILAYKFLQNIGVEKSYVCIDTFEGFLHSQFDNDLHYGMSETYRHAYSANSVRLTRKILDQHGCKDVKLIRGDIVTMPSDNLPNRISVCLLDVDLSEPTYQGLKKIYERMSPGGKILIDDCPPDSHYKARLGYQKFVKEAGLEEKYEFGMGVIIKA